MLVAATGFGGSFVISNEMSSSLKAASLPVAKKKDHMGRIYHSGLCG